jgi:hypothetical protein
VPQATKVYKLIVTDTSPLITLAVANELDVLLRAGVPLIQSAEHILDEAARGGRNVGKQREPATDVEARETLRRQLQDRHRDTPGMER